MRATWSAPVLLASAAALVAPAEASAYFWTGNPELSVHVDWPTALDEGIAKLDSVRVFTCGGGYTDYPVNAWIDPVAGWSTTIAGGDLCGVGLRWGTDVFVESSSFVLRYEELATGFVLGSSGSGTAPLAPFVVTSGTYSGEGPTIRVSLE